MTLTNNEIIAVISKREPIKIGETKFTATKDRLGYHANGNTISNHDIYTLAVKERRAK